LPKICQPKITQKGFVELIAALEHEQWETWAKHILQTENLSQERKDRWFTMFGPYELLPEELKDADRQWAKRVIHLISGLGVQTTPSYFLYKPEIEIQDVCYHAHKREYCDNCFEVECESANGWLKKIKPELFNDLSVMLKNSKEEKQNGK
jgi:hypothetical protein